MRCRPQDREAKTHQHAVVHEAPVQLGVRNLADLPDDLAKVLAKLLHVQRGESRSRLPQSKSTKERRKGLDARKSIPLKSLRKSTRSVASSTSCSKFGMATKLPATLRISEDQRATASLESHRKTRLTTQQRTCHRFPLVRMMLSELQKSHKYAQTGINAQDVQPQLHVRKAPPLASCTLDGSVIAASQRRSLASPQ